MFAWFLWRQLNRIKIKDLNSQVIEVKVSDFVNQKRGSDYIGFYYYNRYERISVQNKTIKYYENLSPQDYKLILHIKRGFFDIYTINHYYLKPIKE